MKVLIVAKTRQGSRACVGGITNEGQSVRLKAADYDRDESVGLEYEVGEVWEIQAASAPSVIPPHVENVIVSHKRKLGLAHDLVGSIERHMPPVCGGHEQLFEGLAQATEAGSLYIAEPSGIPSRSTMFWRPDQPLQREADGRRIRFRYPTADGGRSVVYVGFPEPPPVIPAGTLLRVSLAHWWRPEDSHEEPRCYVQLSGWFGLPEHPEPVSGPVWLVNVHPSEDPEQVSGSAWLTNAHPSEHPERASGPTRPPNDHPSEHPERVSGSARLTNDHQSKDVWTQESVEAAANRPGLEQARELLKSVFGYDDFLPLQAEVIANLLAGRDSLAIMPTGSGKSLCYQLPALVWDGLTLVISPLISLMQDQVTQLQALGIPADCLNGATDYRDAVNIMHQARAGRLKLLYTSPETLLKPETLLLLDECQVACIAIDEAHCISEWGHDFRPEYRQLMPVRRRYPAAVCLGCTATATRRVQDDIATQLSIQRPNIFTASFDRPNLYLQVEPRAKGPEQVMRFLEAHRDQSGIIYCGTRSTVDRLTALLKGQGWSVLPYHAGLDDAQRRRNQEAFSRDRVPIIIATIAFGMGIDKSNVRFVLHHDLPESIESYYQEIGRAGRDGLRADCLLLYNRADLYRVKKFIDEGAMGERQGRHARLNAMLDYAEAQRCRRKLLLGYFGEPTLDERCDFCDVCLSREAADATPVVDVSADARIVLDAIRATGGMYGTAYIADLLRGSRSTKVLERRHDQIPQHGSGRHHSTDHWRHFMDGLVRRDVLARDTKYGGLQLTAVGREVLNGAALALPVTAAKEVVPAPRTAYDEALFELLRALRRELADAEHVPPYVIFSDRTLVELATRCPRSGDALLDIHGIGNRKLRQYGQRLLTAICGYFGEPSPVLACEPEAPKPDWQPLSARSAEVGRLFLEGQSLAELMAAYQVRTSTVVGHLEKCVQVGWQLPPERVLALSQLAAEDRQAALAQFEELGDLRLSPVFEALGGRVPYDELHILRLYRLISRL